MSDFESKVGLNIDVSQALTAIKTLQRQISDFHSSLAKGSATANLKSLQMQQSLIDTVNATGQYSAQMKTVASATQTFTTALEKNKLSMGQYFKYAGGASKSFGRFFRSEMDTVQKVAIERVKDLQTQYIKMGRDANGAIRSIAVRPLALDMDNLATKTQIAAQKQQLLNQLLKQGSTNLLNFGKNTQWAGRQLMVGFTIPLGIFGATAAKTFMQMEEQAIKFKRVYGDTFTATKETDAMLKQIQTLASEFTKYGVAVEKTMEQAAKAAATGKMGAELLAQVSEATRLSVLGNVEQAQALETTISLTNAFGTAADDLRGKINFLNAVENQTVTSIEDLTIAIPKAAPVIQQLGGDVEDLTFFLTAMREGGINASESANALKSGLASLINPTKKASDFLQGFGININKIVEGNKGNVQGLVVDFAKALDTLDPLNRARAIEQLFGKFQFSRLSTLFQNVIKDGSQAAKVLELTRQSSAELGILAQRELNRISASPMYKFQKAIADFKKELAPVGEEFLKAVTPIIQFGTDVLKAFNNLDGGVKQFIVNATGLIAGIGPVFLMTFGLLANGVANIIKGFTFVKTVFNKAASASTILGETTDYMTQQQLEAAAVAASLEQVHNKLTQAFTVETTAVGKLAAAYQRAVAAQNAFTGPPATGKPRKPKKYADGVFSVPGPKGAGDIIPAMLAPGEAVIPAKAAQKYSGFIKGMISGSIPGFNNGETNATPGRRTKRKESRPRNTKTEQGIYNLLGSHLRSKPQGVYNQFIAGLGSEPYEGYSQEQKAGLKAAEAAMRAQGYSEDEIKRNLKNLSGTDLSHLEKQTTKYSVGGKDVEAKDWKHKNLRLDARMFNQYAHAMSGKGQTFFDGLNVSQIAKETGLSEQQVKSEIKKIREGKHPSSKGYSVLAAVGKQDPSYQGKAVAAAYEVRQKSGGYDKAVKAGKLTPPPETDAKAAAKVKSKIARAEVNLANVRGQTQAAPADKRQARTKRKVETENTNAKKNNTKAVNADTKETKKGTATKRNARKKAEKKPVTTATTQAKAAIPNVKVTEQLGNGVTRTVDSNGNERFKVNGKFASPQQAKAAMSGAGAATKPGGRIRGLLTGMPGKLGIAGLATMGAGAVTGNEQVSGLADQLFTAAMLASFVPQGTMSKLGEKFAPMKQKLIDSKLGQSIANSKTAGKFGVAKEAAGAFKGKAAESIAAKGFMKALPGLATGALKVGLQFTKMIPVIGWVIAGLDILYNVATVNAKAQEEISKAIVETLTMTKDKLDKLNEFFGSEAKLSGIRTATVAGEGETGKQASLAEQFRQSEQFKGTYQETAGKLKGASAQQFGMTMQSLGLDLYGQGMSKEQVQIIIDAIKKEAGQTSVKIDFESLTLDTEAGKENLANSFKDITSGAIKEFKSNRDWGLINWEAQSNLDEYEAQVSGFLSGMSQEFSRGRISTQEFNSSWDNLLLSVNKMEQANPGDGMAFLTDTMARLNPELEKATGFIEDATTKANIFKVAMMGIQVPQQLINDLAANPLDVTANTWLQDAEAFADKKSKDLQKQKGVISGITAQQKNLQKTEQNINDAYDERIKALERINQLQQQIANQKQNELDLADALSRGDVFAAAQAVQKIRADQAALAVEQQKNLLEDQKKDKVGEVKDQADALDSSLSSAQGKLQKIQDSSMKAYKSTAKAPNMEDLYSKIGWIYKAANPGLWLSSEADIKKSLAKDVAGLQAFKASLGFASGGYISGPGSGTSDSIPARLSNGEYVIRANAVKAIGTDALDKLNHADKFAKGGMVRGYSEGGSPDAIERRNADKNKNNKNGFIDLSTWKAISQTQKNTRLSSGEKGSLISYILSPTTLHYGSFEPNRQDVDRAIINNKMVIPKGTELARVTAELDKKAMSILKPGQSFLIDQFMSVTNPTDKKFISGMQVGTSDTGGRRAGEKYPLVKYTLVGNAPGIYDMNTILPRHANEKFGKDGGYSSVVDGLLARGQTAKLTHITMDEKLGIPIYHVELGGKSRAKTGLFQNLWNYEQKERFRTSTREDRTNPKVLSWLQEKLPLRSTMPRYAGQSTQSSMNIGRMSPTPFLPGGSSSLPSYGWSGSTQKTRVGNYAKGGMVKRDVTSSDPGINWINSFIQNLLGGGNPSAAMQNDSTKSLLAQSYTQGAKNMGVDPTDPMFYASMFAPSMGLKGLGMAGKGLSKLKGLSSPKNSGPRITLGNYIDTPRVSQAYLNFMRTNPAISVRMRSEQLIDKLAKKDFAYRNAFEEGMVADDLDPRLEAERVLFGLGNDAAPSSRPIYGAGVSPYTPWSIRGKARNENAFERWALRSKSSNINSEYFDRYGDISLLLKNRVKKRSTFTLGDSFLAHERDSYIPGGPKKTVAAPFGTMSQSKILGAATGMSRPDLQFVEAQIFGGLPFSDIKKIIVKNPQMIPLLQQKIAEAGLKIPVGQTKLSFFGKLNEMFYKNKTFKHNGTDTGMSMFIPQYKSGGMFRTPYADGGLARLHDKEFVMNAGAVKDYGVNNLKAMNSGTYNSGSVYNSYGVNINVGGSNSNSSDIARTVIREIKRLDSQNIRSTKV